MPTQYTSEKNALMLIALLKAHGIRKVIVSPGTTNMCFVGSIQNDPFFELYSSVDERSAAYLACGMSAESSEPVVLSCTGATASRNYMPGLTEAYYRKLPVLAVTSSRHSGMIGQGLDQVTDRCNPPNDVQKMSVHIPMIHSENDEWACNVKLNSALLELRHRGGGPVHINIETAYSTEFNIPELPDTRIIHRVEPTGTFPTMKPGKIGIFVGAHKKFDAKLTSSIDSFCDAYDAVVFCDHCSNYKGRYRAFSSLITAQRNCDPALRQVDTLIHLGEVAIGKMWLKPAQVWRVCPDGEVRDPYRKLSYVFEMDEQSFFEHYINVVKNERSNGQMLQIETWNKLYLKAVSRIPDLPFSNLWIAQNTAAYLPEHSALHLGILNSARSWNFFDVPTTVDTYINTGGYGIDGCVSSLLGASLSNPGRLHFGVVGDLAFFYDMNALGNRHIGDNFRLLVINNGRGAEFQLYGHPCVKSGFAEDIEPYMAAAGHFGKKSRQLVRHYAEDLGFEYLWADSKTQYLAGRARFLTPATTGHPILFEVFTNYVDESAALEAIRNLTMDRQ